MTRREAEKRVVRAAMRFSSVWFENAELHYVFRGNNGYLAKLVRACAALSRSRRKGGK